MLFCSCLEQHYLPLELLRWWCILCAWGVGRVWRVSGCASVGSPRVDESWWEWLRAAWGRGDEWRLMRAIRVLIIIARDEVTRVRRWFVAYL